MLHYLVPWNFSYCQVNDIDISKVSNLLAAVLTLFVTFDQFFPYENFNANTGIGERHLLLRYDVRTATRVKDSPRQA